MRYIADFSCWDADWMFAHRKFISFEGQSYEKKIKKIKAYNIRKNIGRLG